jgi:hypothetical protein
VEECFRIGEADYVIAPSHLERFLRYGRNDKVGWRVIRMIKRLKYLRIIIR